jgi:hypothetical protein
MKKLYRCDSVVTASFVATGISRGGEDDCWVGETMYGITRHYPLHPSGPVAQLMFGIGLGPGSNDSKSKQAFFRIFRAFFLVEKSESRQPVRTKSVKM